MKHRLPPSLTAHPFVGQLDVDTAPPPELAGNNAGDATSQCLVILWSAREPQRIGHSAACTVGQVYLLGRAPFGTEDERAMRFAAVRPDDAGGVGAASDIVLGESVSRRQLEVRAERDALVVRNIGRCPMWINGALTARAEVSHGDVIHLQQQLLLLCVNRPRALPPLCGYPRERLSEFGQPDADGIVGESPATWSLRQRIGQCGPSSGHVLIVGASGTGKELVAQAIHRLSPQKNRALVAENIATIPQNLGTALLFGNRRNFPNPGMEERVGLIGLAEHGTLFLDEIGDMSPEVQPLLLRVMERGGEYTRLGDEAQNRRANVRFIAATNHPERLRPELRRRFHHEIHIPELNERREDIPILLRHLLRSLAQERPALTAYLRNGEPRIDPRLIEQLTRHSYSTHVSELAFLLQAAAEGCAESALLPLASHVLRRRAAAPAAHQTANTPLPSDDSADAVQSAGAVLPSAEQVQQALVRESGNVARAAIRLGLSRHQLNRLIRRHQLVVDRGAELETAQPMGGRADS